MYIKGTVLECIVIATGKDEAAPGFWILKCLKNIQFKNEKTKRTRGDMMADGFLMKR